MAVVVDEYGGTESHHYPGGISWRSWWARSGMSTTRRPRDFPSAVRRQLAGLHAHVERSVTSSWVLAGAGGHRAPIRSTAWCRKRPSSAPGGDTFTLGGFEGCCHPHRPPPGSPEVRLTPIPQPEESRRIKTASPAGRPRLPPARSESLIPRHSSHKNANKPGFHNGSRAYLFCSG